MIGRSYEPATCGERTYKVQSRHSARERPARRSRGSLYHCSRASFESNYRPTNLITASEGAGGAHGCRVEMGDAATSIVGRLITLSGCLPQATGVIRPPFIPAEASPRPPSPLPPPPQRNPKTDRADFKEATMRRITRYFHVRWLNWNATGEPRVKRGELLRARTEEADYFESINLIYTSDNSRRRRPIARAVIYFVRR